MGIKKRQNVVFAAWAFLHCKETIPKIWNIYSQKRNCAATVPISHSRVCEWYIFPRTIGLFCCRKYCMWTDPGNSKSLTDTWMWKLGGQAIPRKGIHKWDFHCNVDNRCNNPIIFYTNPEADRCAYNDEIVDKNWIQVFNLCSATSSINRLIRGLTNRG
jgi:hypothetical protein